MSLELKIEKLTEAIHHLIVVLESPKAISAVVEAAQPETPVAKKPKTEKPKAEPTPTPAPAPATTITIESLQAQCLQLVRAKPEFKEKIKSALDGKLIKEIPASEYPDLKEILDNLQSEIVEEAK